MTSFLFFCNEPRAPDALFSVRMGRVLVQMPLPDLRSVWPPLPCARPHSNWGSHSLEVLGTTGQLSTLPALLPCQESQGFAPKGTRT